MQTTIGVHIGEETLARYAAGHLAEHATTALEEHVLMCENCQLQLEIVDEHLRVGAVAAREIRAERRNLKKNLGLSWLFTTPKAAWGVVLAALLICAVVPSYLQRSGISAIAKPPVEIALTSSRGTAQTLISQTAAGHIVLKIDVSELPALSLYPIQIVDANGIEIWSTSAAPSEKQLRLRILSSLSSGQYWVRVFDSDKNQLREFGFNVQ